MRIVILIFYKKNFLRFTASVRSWSLDQPLVPRVYFSFSIYCFRPTSGILSKLKFKLKKQTGVKLTNLVICQIKKIKIRFLRKPFMHTARARAQSLCSKGYRDLKSWISQIIHILQLLWQTCYFCLWSLEKINLITQKLAHLRLF